MPAIATEALDEVTGIHLSNVGILSGEYYQGAKNFFSNNYTYGIMSGVGKNTTTNIYIGVRINE